MSNALAIAAVTRTLRKLVEDAIKAENLTTLPADIRPSSEVEVTTAPLDKARDNASTKNQINLFLYQGITNASWRNQDIPQQVKPGETAFPPLPLNLHYLVTAYGQSNNDQIAHILLGIAARALHDRAILSPAGIESALAASQLQNQVERVKITPHSLSSEEMSKLWTIFQTPYRLSLAYEVSVVLIESTRPTITPSPVLTRGNQDDTGIEAQASLIPPYPTLTAINFTAIEDFKQTLPPDRAAAVKQPAAKVGERIELTGYNLAGTNIKVYFAHPFLKQPITIVEADFDARTSTSITLTLPDPPTGWLAGSYTVTVEMTLDAGTPQERVVTTNGLALPIAPKPSSILVARPPGSDTVTLTVTCQPAVSIEQQVTLLLTVLGASGLAAGGTDIPLTQISDRPLTPAPVTPTTPPTLTTNTLKFELRKETLTRLGIPPASPTIDQRIKAGTYQIRPRLRVDGVDSLVVNYASNPPVFIGQQSLVIPL